MFNGNGAVCRLPKIAPSHVLKRKATFCIQSGPEAFAHVHLDGGPHVYHDGGVQDPLGLHFNYFQGYFCSSTVI